MEIVIEIVAAALAGAAIGIWLGRRRAAGDAARILREAAAREQELVTRTSELRIAETGRVAAEARESELRRTVLERNTAVATAQAAARDAEVSAAAAVARAEAAVAAAGTQRATWDEATARLKDTFAALANEALRISQAELLAAADAKFEAATEKTIAETDSRRAAIEQQVKDLESVLEAYRAASAQLEKQRAEDLGRVEQQYRDLATAASGIQKETAKLVAALRSPHVRGRWGQMTLRRTAELAGMVERCDFYEQETVEREERRLRPDMIVRLPTERLVVVDSKVPLTGYLDSLDASTDSERDAALDRHAKQTHDHVVQLASREYQAQFERTPEFVVQFVPNDSVLTAAVQRDPGLIEFAMSRGVVIATPSTLFALLRTVAHSWRQEQVAESARQVSFLGKRLAERLATFIDHLETLGGSLRRAVDAYNASVGSLETRVLPSARQLSTLAGSAKQLPAIAPVDVVPRAITTTALPEGAQEIFPEDEIPSIEDLTGEVLSQRSAAGREPTYTCTCRVCGATFEGAGPNSRYCSDRCKDRALELPVGEGRAAGLWDAPAQDGDA